MTLPTVRVVVLGGTITMAPSSEGITPKLTGDDLLKLLPDIDQVANVLVETPFLKPGASIEPEEVIDLARGIQTQGANGIAGTVVVQGTDTIDETSYMLDILCDTPEPVIVTGSMRGAAALSADGPANLMAAIRTAADPAARSHGAMVILNDEIHAARSVEKSHKALLSSFESLQGGPIGYVFENKVEMIRQPATRNAHLTPTRFGKVAMIKAGLGSHTDLIDALPSLGYEGAVIEATGVGHLPAKFVEPLEKLSKQMPVVLCSRVNKGPVFTNTYGFPGSEIDLLKRGLLRGHWLSAHKARLLLGCLIGANVPHDQLADQLALYGQA